MSLTRLDEAPLLRVTRTDSFSMRTLSVFECLTWDAVVQYLTGMGFREEGLAPDTQFERVESVWSGGKLASHKVIYRIEFIGETDE